MRKNFKKFAVSLVTIGALSASLASFSASASGTVRCSTTGTGTNTAAIYNYDVDGSTYRFGKTGAHQGQIGSKGFAVSSSGSYQFMYSGASNAGATVYVFRESDDTRVATISIPKYVSGMPTIYKNVDLSGGQYYVHVVSDSSSTYSTGSFTVKKISGTYNH